MTPAQKAAATRRANRAAGIPPKSTGRTKTKMRGGPAFATAKPTVQEHRLIVLAALTDLLAVKQAATGITQEARDAFDKFQKLLSLGLGATSNSAMQNEADSALRTAAVHLVKLAF